MAGQWVSDGSQEITISPDGSIILCKTDSNSGGNVYNALWKENEGGITSGTHYWKINATFIDSIFVGLTDLGKFKKGWGVKGLFYGGPGNTSTGSSLLTMSYGPEIKSGNTVGILAVFEGEKLKVYFDLNGTPLGLAFDLPASVLKEIFPVVQFGSTGKATCVECFDIPTDLLRKEPVYNGIEGDWECIEYNGELSLKGVTLGIFKDGKSYKVHLHVVNGINCRISRSFLTGSWQTTNQLTTLMGGSPEWMKFESQMSSLIKDPSKIEVEGNFLIIISLDRNSNTKWKRYSTKKSPVTDPF